MRSDSRFEVNLKHFQGNLDLIKNKTQKQLLLMIKADAYGHGILPIVEHACGAGVTEFGVASLGEAKYLRNHLPQLDFDLYVFSELNFPEQKESYSSLKIIPVISCLEDLRFFLEDEVFSHVPLCLKFNTGMNRLGILESDVAEAAQLLKDGQRTTVQHLMSHFANASMEIKDGCMSNRQYSQFKKIKDHFLGAGINLQYTSMANSGAIEQGFAYAEETHVRPGILAYGASALIPKLRAKFPWQGNLVSSLKSKIMRTLSLQKGDPIGYGAMVVHRDCEVAILPMGYGDGLFRSLEKCPIKTDQFSGQVVGRVNMDMISLMVDAGTKPVTGTEILLWNNDPQSIYQLSDHSRTIPYEILCHVGQRIPRSYIN